MKRMLKKGCRMFILVFIAVGISCFLRDTFDRMKEEKAAATEYRVEYTIAENKDILRGLLPEKWSRITAAEKQRILQTAANTEANYLGIRKPLPVRVMDLEEGTLGRYVPEDHEIWIDEDYVANSPVQEVLETVCHEAYHGYQVAVVDVFREAEKEKQALLLFRRAEIYEEELSRYQTGKEDYRTYYHQKLEEDARQYSGAAVQDWYEKLNTEK